MRSTPLRAPPSRGLVLAMLLIVYTFNFLDRQMLGILAQPIKADLGLSDAQFGAIGGIAFAILYSVLGVPLAVPADKTSRAWVITGGLTVRGGFTSLCGVANSLWHFETAGASCRGRGCMSEESVGVVRLLRK